MTDQKDPFPVTPHGRPNLRLWVYCALVLGLFVLFVISFRPGSIPPGVTPTLRLPCGTQPLQPPSAGNPLIAFSSLTNWGTFEICIMNADGSASYSVTRDGKNNYAWAWSPDNKQILFESGSGWETNVYVMSVDGSDLIKVNKNTSAIGGDWSPDGKRVVYTEGDNPYRVHIVNADGTNDTILPPLGGNSRPRWSPDGRKLLFWSAGTGNGVQIYTMDADGSNLIQLTNRGSNDDPNWSPDGSKIIFVSDRDYVHPPTPISVAARLLTGTPLYGIYQLYVMNADGSNVRKLTNSGDNFAPSWSPDGTRIAFERLVGERHQIFVMDADGSNMIKLTNSGDNRAPVWSH